MLRKIFFAKCKIEDAQLIANFYEKEGQKENDLATLNRILAELDKWGFCIIAKYKRRILGIVNIRRFPDEVPYYRDWWMWGLLVGKRYRNFGIGKTLVEMIIESAKGAGAKEVKLIVNSKALPAINLYKKLGFKEISIPGLDEELARNETKINRKDLIMGLKV